MKKNPFTLDKKIALITGGAKGIGYGIATSFINAGAKVILLGRNEPSLQKACKVLGKDSQYIVFDIDQQKKIPAVIESIEKNIGNIDILVNNAGRHHKDLVVNTSDEDFLSVLQTNLLSVFTLSRECAQRMLERRSGSVILISSMTAGVAMEKVVAYSAAKTALIGMMRSMAVEFGKCNVRVNAIAPGWIESDMLEAALKGDAERKAKILGRIPSRKFGKPSDIGSAAVFLASDASAYINNTFLPVDGGAFQAL
jgi:gluconate 5-dehydrogenase